ncbi:ring-cleaving dioxygenase [Carnobacterium pleistocenium]|uniref:ring-cleaving dioxygenase n=1 Tax=Carnobacterium pleistocenium TaxID=181073 RepID=UPI00054EFD5B|nr:ring-cleaving dioxygenase [Carnobacterium pleistocenium]
MKKTAGIHHITAIVGHPQENIDFYAGILGLRLIKKTVNFDDPGTYHLYFGNDGGKPGTIITFFPWAGAAQGKIGGGQVGVITYAIPVGTLSYWETRLAKFDIQYEKTTRFSETYLQFEDYHGLQLELVERAEGQMNNWTFGEVTPEVAIKGFGGAVLYSTDPTSTIETLQETMGLEKVAEEDELVRLKAYGDIGNIIDISLLAVAPGQMGVGTVHHIAWRAKDETDHVDWQNHVYKKGYDVTEIKDRNYFNAIYFREYGDILFEIATDTPGFAHDESYETMGQALKLPAQYESARDQLTSNLIPIKVTELD